MCTALFTAAQPSVYTQWCKFMSKNSNLAREIPRGGRGRTRIGGATKKREISRTSWLRNIHHWVSRHFCHLFSASSKWAIKWEWWGPKQVDRGYWPRESQWWGCQTFLRCSGPGASTTGASWEPRRCPKDRKFYYLVVLATKKQFWGFPTSPRWSGSVHCTTDASKISWGCSSGLIFFHTKTHPFPYLQCSPQFN